MPARDAFQVVTDPDTGDFYIAMPDGESETDDWTSEDDVAIFAYGGRSYICAGPASSLVLEGNTAALMVTGLGGQFKTEQIEWEGDGEDDAEGDEAEAETETEGGDDDVPIIEEEDEELDEDEEVEPGETAADADGDEDEDDEDDDASDDGIL